MPKASTTLSIVFSITEHRAIHRQSSTDTSKDVIASGFGTAPSKRDFQRASTANYRDQQCYGNVRVGGQVVQELGDVT